MARPSIHLAASLALAALQWQRTRRLLPTVAPLATGFLVDADHLVDHQLYRRLHQEGWDLQVLALHGWEYLAPLAWLEARPLRGRTSFGLVLGLLLHLAIDQLANDTRDPLTYFLLYRASRRFRGGFFGGEPEQHAWRKTPLLRLWEWW